MGAPYSEPVDRAELILQPLFDRYQVLEFSGGTIFRGPISAYCRVHRRAVESGLRRLPGAYCFERLDSRTYLTYTVPAPHVKPVNVWLHLFLLLATVVTTLVAGANARADQVFGAIVASVRGEAQSMGLGELVRLLVIHGGPFSFAILLILGAHECGHYIMARRYGMLVTPPFFLPAPVPPIGTFGAVIKIRSPMMHRRALLDIGLAGPLAGMVVALPLLVYGLMHSEFEILRYWEKGTVRFGDSLLTWGLTRWLVGVPEPGYVLNWVSHPFAWAGWIGLLVTSLNLFPIGQLDGGHVAYALVGRRQRAVAWVVIGILLAFSYTRSPVWLLWCVLVPLLVKVSHPPVVVDEVELGLARRAAGWLAFAVLMAVFMPAPVVPVR